MATHFLLIAAAAMLLLQHVSQSFVHLLKEAEEC
jgi:hypothetical protein